VPAKLINLFKINWACFDPPLRKHGRLPVICEHADVLLGQQAADLHLIARLL